MIWPSKILQNHHFERILFMLRDPAPLISSFLVDIIVKLDMALCTKVLSMDGLPCKKSEISKME